MKLFLCVSFSAFLVASSGHACDVCSTSVNLAEPAEGLEWNAGLTGQFSSYEPSSDGDPGMDSSTIQLVLARRLGAEGSLQLATPYHDRTLEDAEERGLGDLVVVAARSLWHVHGEGVEKSLHVYGGIKAPTGDSGALADEAMDEPMQHDEHAMHHAGHMMDEAEHSHSVGHHLALGSGSWDGLAGLRCALQFGTLSTCLEAQYTFRTEGDYDFKYGDQLTWRAGASLPTFGVETLLLGVDLSGEWRDDNEIAGERQVDTGKTTAYVGPTVALTLQEGVRMTGGYDFAIQGQDSGLHGAADQRVRAAVNWQF